MSIDRGNPDPYLSRVQERPPNSFSDALAVDVIGDKAMTRPGALCRLRKYDAARDYLAMILVVAVCSLAGWVSYLSKLTEANIVMIFLAGVAVVATRYGRGPAVGAVFLSVLVFDFFFVSPSFSFAISDAQYFITLGVMLGIGLLISALTSQLQLQLRDSETNEHRTAQLYALTRHLTQVSGHDGLLESAACQLARIFDGEVVLYLHQKGKSLGLQVVEGASLAKQPTSALIVQWVFEHARMAGAGTETSPDLTALFVPMTGSQRTIGVLGIQPHDEHRFSNFEERRMLEACASLIALSFERNQSIEEAHQAQMEAQQARLQVQSEQVRNSLLCAVSHDLRTPLATIAMTAASLLEEATEQSWPQKKDSLHAVLDGSYRLSRQIENLLGHARLSSGAITITREWEALEELIEAALGRLRGQLGARTVHVAIGNDLPPLWVAGDLMEHVFLNLLENAVHYTPITSKISITGALQQDHVEITVADDGPGLTPGSESQVFDKYFRGTDIVADGRRGIGLGLTICKEIIQAHGGTIRAANRPGGGAEFTIFLACDQASPVRLPSELVVHAHS